MKSFRMLKVGVATMALVLAGLLQAAAPVHRDAAGSQAKGKIHLQAKLEAMDWYASSEPLNVRFTLENPTSESVWVMGWMLPSEDMDAKLFTVRRDGEAATYLGPLVKRAAPDVEDWVEIKAGQSFTLVFDPSASYGMTSKGQYSIEYRVRHLAIRHKAPQRALDPGTQLLAAKPVDADTQPHGKVELTTAAGASFFYEGLPVDALAKPGESTIIGGYSKCTTSQQSILATAHQNAITISGKALSALNGSSPYHFTTWFGPATSSSITTIKGHFTKINGAFTGQSVTYDCSCKKRYYAYVYPTQPYKIYVCSVFWKAPALGRDCQAGTLVHEMSHFNVTASTDDYVYGASGAASLAISDPAKAMDNADNHEYFAEDQP